MKRSAPRQSPTPRGAGTPRSRAGGRPCGFVMNPISTRITGTSAQLKPVKSLRSLSPRSGKPSARTSSAWTSSAARLLASIDVVRPASPERGIQRVRPAGAPVGEPSAWIRRNSRAPARFAIRARAMFPMLAPAFLVRVITTRTPARSSSGRSRSATRRFSSASVSPETTPRVPPPSLIFRVEEPGPDRLGLRDSPAGRGRDRRRRRAPRRLRGRQREREKREDARRTCARRASRQSGHGQGLTLAESARGIGTELAQRGRSLRVSTRRALRAGG